MEECVMDPSHAYGGISKDQKDRDIPLEEFMLGVVIDRRMIRTLHTHE